MFAVFFFKCDKGLQKGNSVELYFYYNNKNSHDKFLFLGLHSHDQFRVFSKVEIKNSKIEFKSSQYKFNPETRKEISLNKDITRLAKLSSTKINKIKIKISRENTVLISLNNIKLPVHKLSGDFSKVDRIVIVVNSSDFLIHRFSIYKDAKKLTSLRFDQEDKIRRIIITPEDFIEDVKGGW